MFQGRSVRRAVWSSSSCCGVGAVRFAWSMAHTCFRGWICTLYSYIPGTWYINRSSTKHLTTADTWSNADDDQYDLDVLDVLDGLDGHLSERCGAFCHSDTRCVIPFAVCSGFVFDGTKSGTLSRVTTFVFDKPFTASSAITSIDREVSLKLIYSVSDLIVGTACDDMLVFLRVCSLEVVYPVYANGHHVYTSISHPSTCLSFLHAAACDNCWIIALFVFSNLPAIYDRVLLIVHFVRDAVYF